MKLKYAIKHIGTDVAITGCFQEADDFKLQLVQDTLKLSMALTFVFSL